MDQQIYTITFDNGSVADANRWAGELKEYIEDIPDAEVKQQQDNLYSQDLGTTVVLILGTPAILAVARALGNWLIRHREVSITIKTPEGEVVGDKLTSQDAVKLAELLLPQRD